MIQIILTGIVSAGIVRDVTRLTKALLFVVIPLWANAQANCQTYESDVWKYSVSKNGKATNKECLWVIVCQNTIEFRITYTSVQTFILTKENGWVTFGAEKAAQRTESGGVVSFFVGDTKYSYKL